MSTYRHTIVIVFAALAFTVSISASASAQYAQPVSIHGGLGLTTTSYNRSAAERSNTVGRGFGFQSFMEPRFYETVGVPVMIGWEYLGPICLDANDGARCENRTERRTSLLFASLGVAAYGPSLPLGTNDPASAGRAYIIAGREWVSRGIGDDRCLSCWIDDVQFDGGLFVEPGLELPAGDNVFVGLGYRMYSGTSDLENRLVIRFSTQRRRSR